MSYSGQTVITKRYLSVYIQEVLFAMDPFIRGLFRQVSL